jgi:predicted transposase YbfD/YdcC
VRITITEHFEELEDPRQEGKIEHKLSDIILLCISALLCGAEGWHDIEIFGQARLEWLKKYGSFANGIPVDDTIARVMSALNPKQFQSCFINWMKAASEVTEGDIVSVDGKTLRHSFDRKNSKRAIHMVSAFAKKNGVVLGQSKTEEKSNEITAIPELLDLLELKGCIVTIDAMGCQQKITKKIIDKEADYVIMVKGNQGYLSDDIISFFDICHQEEFKNVSYDFYEETDKGHGRFEIRRYWISSYLKNIRNTEKWKNLKTIGMVESERHIGDQITLDKRYYISSISEQAKVFSNAVRGHWGIENTLHWTLDMTFREDESRIRRDNAAENLAVLRHIALNALRQEKTFKKSIKAKRYKATLEPAYTDKLIQPLIDGFL